MKLFFNWDPHKARLNEKKHGVSFNEAATVFSDRQLLIKSDPNHAEEGDRFVCMGLFSKEAHAPRRRNWCQRKPCASYQCQKGDPGRKEGL